MYAKYSNANPTPTPTHPTHIQELTILTERLGKINEDLARKLQARNEFDATIQETEAAYMKILESSQTLLSVLKRESVALGKRSS